MGDGEAMGTAGGGAERTYRLTLEYDGAGFAGWQRQPRGERTVQGVVEQALGDLVGVPVPIMGSGRTDAGVHAHAQVASARFATRLEPPTLTRALNARLPRDTVLRDVGIAPDGFDARRCATAKTYRYSIWNGAVRSPLREARQAHVAARLDLAAMREAAAVLIGEHDFAAFRAAGSEVETSVRTLFSLVIDGAAGGEVTLEVRGSGFLRHMVRNLAGTLVEVGHGRRNPAALGALLASRDRRQAGPTAAAHGLALVGVEYPERWAPLAPSGDDSALESSP